MNIFNLFRKDIHKSLVNDISLIADKGIKNIHLPERSLGINYEIFMLDMWFCMELSLHTIKRVEHRKLYELIEIKLAEKIQELGLPTEKKYERLFVLMTEKWEYDFYGLMRSNYPQTKQYIPETTYLYMVKHPLKFYVEEKEEELINEIPFEEIMDFLNSYANHINWLRHEMFPIIQKYK